MNMPTIYGIPNCDTMKKARTWLAEHGIEYEFHDYKKAGIDEATLRGWAARVGWETLLNRRGMMWRKLPQEVRDSIAEESAVRLMLDTPSIIKRPVLDVDGDIHVGFKADEYQALLGR